MIEGEFNERGQLIFVIALVDANSEPISVNALFDTGFDYWLAMNTQDIESLGWHRQDIKRPMQTARGEVDFDEYEGIVIFDQQKYIIPVLGENELQEIIIGVSWLRTHRLVADLPAKILTLG